MSAHNRPLQDRVSLHALYVHVHVPYLLWQDFYTCAMMTYLRLLQTLLSSVYLAHTCIILRRKITRIPGSARWRATRVGQR